MKKTITKKKGKYDVDFKYNLKVYWSFLRNYKWQFIFITALLLVNEVFNLVQNLLFKKIIDEGTAYGNQSLTLDLFISLLISIAVVYLVIAVLKTIIKWWTTHIQNKLEGHLMKDLKQKFFNHIITLSHSFHVTHKTGSLISRINRGSAAMERMTDFFIYSIFPVTFQMVLIGGSLFYLDKTSALVIFVTMVVFIVFTFYVQQMQRKQNQILNMAEDIEKANLGDIMTNIDSIKYFGKEDMIKQRYANLTKKTNNELIKLWNYSRWVSSIQSLIVWLGTFFLVFFSIKNYIKGNITLGTLAFTYSIYGSFMWGPVSGLMNGIRGYYRSMVDFNDLFQYGEIKQEVEDKPGAKSVKIEEGEIEFKNVSFKYNNKKILDNFNLKIKPGEKVALVGHSGSGKTTLVKLLYRFYDVNTGTILVDGKDVRNIKQESLRSELSIVPQECVLFDDTVYNNILFSNPKASRYEVLNAIKSAQLDKTVRNFPNKEETIVGQRGVKLSGGEKQRVSIARALLANKKVIVLDEATSSLDSQTESEIQKDLEKLLEGRTSIIIAHRLSTIMKADKIIVLEGGKIVQTGSHNNLINKPGLYKKLWNLQKGGYIGE